MKTTTLKEFCADHGQEKAAQVLGCTQGNVSQALARDREIYIVEVDHGFSFYEIKRRKRKVCADGQISAA